MGSQRQLVERLRAAGYAVTQTTISRDLKALGAIKVRIGSGEVCYRTPAELVSRPDRRQLERVVSDFARSIESVGQLVVIKTPPGAAQVVASQVDHAGWEEVAGTIAGDDTVAVITASAAKARRLAERLGRLTGERA